MPVVGRAGARRTAGDAAGRSALTGRFRHRAFGLSWRSDIALDGFAVDTDALEPADIAVRLVDHLPERVATGRFGGSTLHPDGVRFGHDPDMVFDIVNGRHVDCLPRARWSGRMPLRFHATIAALTLAWRGGLPMHASAIAINGRGILLCGASGAGKSTLAASLLAQGAAFIGDDLTMLWPGSARTVQSIAPGRPGMRLHAATAQWIEAERAQPDDADGRGKWRVEPMRYLGAPVPLAAVAIIGAGPDQLNRHLFRPRWMAALPGQPSRLARLAQMRADLPIIGLPAVAITDRVGFDTLGKATMSTIAAALDRAGASIGRPARDRAAAAP